jgi:hypothetical protein
VGGRLTSSIRKKHFEVHHRKEEGTLTKTKTLQGTVKVMEERWQMKGWEPDSRE